MVSSDQDQKKEMMSDEDKEAIRRAHASMPEYLFVHPLTDKQFNRMIRRPMIISNIALVCAGLGVTLLFLPSHVRENLVFRNPFIFIWTCWVLNALAFAHIWANRWIMKRLTRKPPLKL